MNTQYRYIKSDWWELRWAGVIKIWKWGVWRGRNVLSLKRWANRIASSGWMMVWKHQPLSEILTPEPGIREDSLLGWPSHHSLKTFVGKSPQSSHKQRLVWTSFYMSHETKILKLTKEWPQHLRAKNEAIRKREKNSASLWNWFQLSLLSHLSLSSLLCHNAHTCPLLFSLIHTHRSSHIYLSSSFSARNICHGITFLVVEQPSQYLKPSAIQFFATH